MGNQRCIRNTSATVADTPRKHIGIAGTSLLVALIVCGIPGLDPLSKSIEIAVRGYSLRFLSTAEIGVAFIVYRFM